MRDLVTTALDLVGLVAVVVALALFVSTYSIPGAVACFGFGLLGASALIELRAPKPKSDPAAEVDF